VLQLGQHEGLAGLLREALRGAFADAELAGGVAQGGRLLADVGEVCALEQSGQLLEGHAVGDAHADGRAEQGVDHAADQLVVGEVVCGGCVWFHEEPV